MTISPTSLSSVTAVAAPAPITRTQTTSAAAPTNDGDADDQTQLSPLGKLMSKLQDLESSDPAKAKQVLSSIATALADKASAAGTTDPRLQALSDKFATAASTGNLSGLQPAKGQHHHHHHAQAATPAGGAPPAAGATPATGKAAGYAGGGDVRAVLESAISAALDSASA
jgi:hypothetical protein